VGRYNLDISACFLLPSLRMRGESDIWWGFERDATTVPSGMTGSSLAEGVARKLSKVVKVLGVGDLNKGAVAQRGEVYRSSLISAT